MLQYIFKLPNWLLIKISGKKLIEIGKRALHPPYQLLLKLNENAAVDYDSITPEEFRSAFSQDIVPKKLPKDITWKDHEIGVDGGSIKIREYQPPVAEDKSPALVYFHGGGWVIGDVDSHHELTANLCKKLGVKVFSVDYRLSPEYKFPIPLNDCNTAFDWILNNAEDLGIDSERLSVGGDSAGGNLSACLCLLRKSESRSMPKSQLLIYPVTNLSSMETGSYQECEEGFYLSKKSMEWFREHYLNSTEERTNPLCSPLLAENLTDHPPAVITTAGFDPLRDEGYEYSEKLKEFGVSVSYIEYPGYIHGFASMGFIPGTDEALDELCAELSRHI